LQHVAHQGGCRLCVTRVACSHLGRRDELRVRGDSDVALLAVEATRGGLVAMPRFRVDR
jgi:hypothetical protein